MWKSLPTSTRKIQGATSTLSVEWCVAMPYPGKKDDHKLGTANWLSDHYLGFTRLPVYHFIPFGGSIHLPEDKNKGNVSFQENPGPMILSNVKHVGRRDGASQKMIT